MCVLHCEIIVQSHHNEILCVLESNSLVNYYVFVYDCVILYDVHFL